MQKCTRCPFTTEIYLWSAVAATVIALTSCNINTKDISDSAKSVKETGEHIEKAAEHISKIDPVGLKDLLEKNENMRTALAGMEEKLRGLPLGAGVVVLEGTRVQVEIPSYSGAFRVGGYIDDSSNWFWQTRELPRLDYKFPIDFVALCPTPNIPHGGQMGNLMGSMLIEPVYRKMIAAAQTKAEEQFSDFLKSSQVIPQGPVQPIDLQQQLLSEGRHVVRVLITPVEANRTGTWTAKVRLVTVRGATTELLKEADISSTSYPQVKFGEAVPIDMIFTVKNQK